jgi:hypothetical protein
MDPQPKGQCGARRRKQTGRGYGVGQPLGVGALEYVPNNTSNVVKPVGGRRSKKKSAGRRRKTAGRRRKTVRGGGSIGTVGYGYTGTGERGLANAGAYVSNPPTTNAGYPMKYAK